MLREKRWKRVAGGGTVDGEGRINMKDDGARGVGDKRDVGVLSARAALCKKKSKYNIYRPNAPDL